MMLFNLNMLISADEIFGFNPSCMPKMPASPLMAFLYRPHESPSVPTGGPKPFICPNPSIFSAQNLRSVNELQEGRGRSSKAVSG